jgi:hypothetical protein
VQFVTAPYGRIGDCCHDDSFNAVIRTGSNNLPTNAGHDHPKLSLINNQ